MLWGRAREAAAGRAGKGEAETRSNKGGAETRGVESDVGRTGGLSPLAHNPLPSAPDRPSYELQGRPPLLPRAGEAGQTPHSSLPKGTKVNVTAIYADAGSEPRPLIFNEKSALMKLSLKKHYPFHPPVILWL